MQHEERVKQNRKESNIMDREKLLTLKNLLTDLLMNEPSDENLDYDDDAIAIYEELHNLKDAMENYGFDFEI